MAGSKDSLGSFGTILGLIGALIAIGLIIAGIFNFSIQFLSSQSFLDLGLGISLQYYGIDFLRIIWAILLLLVCTGKINIGEPILEGIVLLVLGLLLGALGGIVATIGGILIIIDAIF